MVRTTAFLRTSIVSLAAVAACGLAGATAAHADPRTETTTWFTLGTQPPTASDRSYFVDTFNHTAGARVDLEDYETQRPTADWEFPTWADQRWTPVLPEYPSSPDVTESDGIVDAILEFLLPGFEGGGSAGSGPSNSARPDRHIPSIKFVNQGSGHCLASGAWNGNGTSVIQETCWGNRAAQVWSLDTVAGTNGHYSTLSQTVNGLRYCLDVTDFQNAAGTTLQMWRCKTEDNWNQQFRDLVAGSATCETRFAPEICGVRD